MDVLNTNELLLSIIIPIYNAKETLDRCLVSILNEKRISLEVICVNDGSTDDSLERCYEYQKKDSRIKVINRKNGGVASARNSGLKIAKGKYVTFVDQDDWVEKDAYYEMLTKAIGEDADMIVCNYTKDFGNDMQEISNHQVIESPVSSIEKLILYAFYREEYRGYAAFVWNKLFRRTLLEKNNICFEENLKRGDDVLFYTGVALLAPKMVYIDKSLYHYVQRVDSITHTLTKENMERLGEILIGYDKAISMVEDRFPSLCSVSCMKCFYVYHASVLYKLAKNFELDDKKDEYALAISKFFEDYKKQNETYQNRIEELEKILQEHFYIKGK